MFANSSLVEKLPNRARTLGTRLSVSQDTWDQVLRKVPLVERLPNRARTLGTRLSVSPDTWDQVLRKVNSVERLPNRARTLGTRLFVSPDTWDQVLRNVPSVDRLPNRAWKRGTRLIKFHVFGGHENGIRKHLITFSGSLEIRQYVRQLTPQTQNRLLRTYPRSIDSLI